MRRAAKVDANQDDIVSKLRKCGVSCQLLNAVGDACPDIIAGWRGRNTLLEIKDAKTPVTKTQEEWHAKWGGQVRVVRSFEEAMEAVIEASK